MVIFDDLEEVFGFVFGCEVEMDVVVVLLC